jgi:polar amino acid transport system substrate-binding protein
MPPDKWGRQRVDFGTFYFVDRDAYLVPRGSRLKMIDEVDNRRVRVIAIEGSTTDRAAARRLRNTRVNPVDSIEGALEMLRTGQADALAFTHASLAPLVERVPGSRILEGSFERVGFAFAVPKNRLYALDYVTIFTEDAKASGLVQRAFDNAGLKNSQPAKPDSTAPVFWSFVPQDDRDDDRTADRVTREDHHLLHKPVMPGHLRAAMRRLMARNEAAPSETATSANNR